MNLKIIAKIKRLLKISEQNKKVFCKDCKFLRFVKVNNSKYLVYQDEKDHKIKRESQYQNDYGCLYNEDIKIDYVTGKKHAVLWNCIDRNMEGKCSFYIKKKYLFWK